MTDGEIRLNIQTNLGFYMGTGKCGHSNTIVHTTKEIAEKTGLTRENVRHAKYEGFCSLLALIKIADALNVTVNDLIYYRKAQ